MDHMLIDATTRAHRYLDGLSSSPSHLPRRPRRPEGARHAAQDHPLEQARVLEELDDIGSPATVATPGGRFFGFVL